MRTHSRTWSPTPTRISQSGHVNSVHAIPPVVVTPSWSPRPCRIITSRDGTQLESHASSTRVDQRSAEYCERRPTSTHATNPSTVHTSWDQLNKHLQPNSTMPTEASLVSERSGQFATKRGQLYRAIVGLWGDEVVTAAMIDHTVCRIEEVISPSTATATDPRTAISAAFAKANG